MVINKDRQVKLTFVEMMQSLNIFGFKKPYAIRPWNKLKANGLSIKYYYV